MAEKNRATTGLDQRQKGPTSLEGAEASELPDKGRGSVETDYGKEAGRKTPEHSGGPIGGDAGIRGMPDAAEADDHGYRGKA